MGNVKDRNKKARSLNELAGVEIFTDSQPRDWYIKVYSIGEIPLKLHPAFAHLFAGDLGGFIQNVVYDPGSSPMLTIRRALGMADYSLRYVKKNFLARDMRGIEDAVCQANFDKSAEEFFKLTEEKKKAILRMQAT